MPDNVRVLAIERGGGQAEDQARRESAGTVVRIQERSGTATNVTIRSSVLGLDQTIHLGPWEPKTLLVHLSGNGPLSLRELSLLET